MTYRTALITGASSGLGRGLALELGRRGTHVIVAARRKQQLDDLVKEIERNGGEAEALELDVGDGDAAYETLRKLDAHRPIDLVIANAGVGGITSGKRLEWNAVKQILEVNVLGFAATVSGVLPGMVARNEGHVVAIASLAGFRGLPGAAAYAASKSAVINFMESLRLDLHSTGVHVTAICPGYVKTDMTAKNPGPMPFLMELDDAVKVMMKAIDRKDAICLFPKPMAAGVQTGKLLPHGLYDWVVRRMKMTA